MPDNKHIFQVLLSCGSEEISLTNDEYAFELGYSPLSDGSKEVLSESLNLIAMGANNTSQVDIRKKGSDINRFFSYARARWGSHTKKPVRPDLPAVYFHVDGLRSEILNGKVNWHSVSYTNWEDGKALLPIHITRQAFFEDEIEVPLDAYPMQNNGSKSSKSFGSYSTTIQGDRIAYPEIILRNTTNSNRRSDVFWVGMSSLDDCDKFKPMLHGQGERAWSGTNAITAYTWEMDNVSLSIAKGTMHCIIARFNSVPVAAASVNDEFYVRVRMKISMEKLTTLYTSNWREMTPDSYQMVGEIPLPPWKIDRGSGRLYLHMEMQTNYQALSRVDLDFLHCIPTDAGIIMAKPQGYSLPYNYELLIDKKLRGSVSSGHAYYTIVGEPLKLTPRKIHRLHVLHGSNTIGTTDSDRTTAVTLMYRPRFNVFSDKREALKSEINETGPTSGGIPVMEDERVSFIGHSLPGAANYIELRITEDGVERQIVESGLVKIDWGDLIPDEATYIELKVIEGNTTYPAATYEDVLAQVFLK